MRMGINVPDELLQRVKVAHPGLNLSQLVRETLEDVAQRHETIQARIEYDEEYFRVESERLTGLPEIYRTEPDWIAIGWEDARAWVNHVDPDDWRRIVHNYELYEAHDGFLARHYGRFIRDRYDEYAHWFESQAFTNPNAFSDAVKLYEGAWLAYVLEVRSRCLDLIDGSQARLRAEREKARRAWPVPELPPWFTETSEAAETNGSDATRQIVLWDFQNVGVTASDIQKVDEEIMGNLSRISPSADNKLFKVFCRPDQHAATTELRYRKWRVKEHKNDIDRILIQECRSDCGQAPEETVLILCTKDGDFANLVKEMREWGVQVYVMGPKDSSKRLIEAAGSNWIELKWP